MDHIPFFHVSRNNKYNSDDFIEWDWSSKKEFESLDTAR